MTTVREIATNIGVAPSTVSRALSGSSRISEQVRDRVLREARRLGYGRGRSAPRVGFVTLGIAFLNKYAWPQFTGYDSLILAGMVRGAREARADVTFVDLQQRLHGESYRSFLAGRGVHGLILRVDDETGEVVDEAPRCRVCIGSGRGRDPVGVGIRHAQELEIQGGIVQQDASSYICRDCRRRVRHMKDHR